MKKIFFLALFTTIVSNDAFAQTDLYLTGNGTMCNDVVVYLTARDAACGYLATSQPFTVSIGNTGPIDLTQASSWQSWTPTGTWSVEEVFVINHCGWAPSGGITAGCTSNIFEAITMYTGINGGCGAYTANDCFEYSISCGGCAIGDDAFIGLTVAGNDITVTVN